MFLGRLARIDAFVGGTALTACGNASLDASGILAVAAADDSYASSSSSTRKT